MTVGHAHERRNPLNPLRRAKDYRPDGTRRRRWSGPERSYRLSYRRRPLLTLVSTIVAVLLPATIVYGGTSLGSAARPPEGKKSGVGELSWAWSDGSTDAHRVFNSSAYKDANALPRLKVHVTPGQSGLLYLEFQQDGDWNAEWVTKPDASGNATVPIDPYCADKSWCDGNYKYRLKMPGLVSYLDIEYWDQ